MKLKNKIYFTLGALFCVIVVTGNLIFQKFVTVSLSSQITFELSVGVLLYPITFLLTDITTEIYGKEAAKHVVISATICSFLVMFLIFIADLLPATDWSKVDNQTFSRVFSVYGVGALASLIASFIAQMVDVNIYSWLKNKTKGRHLWLRNNVSTIIAQLVDTFCVILFLCCANLIPWDKFASIISYSFSFKVIAAIFDTPFCYLGCYFLKSKFILKED